MFQVQTSFIKWRVSAKSGIKRYLLVKHVFITFANSQYLMLSNDMVNRMYVAQQVISTFIFEFSLFTCNYFIQSEE